MPASTMGAISPSGCARWCQEDMGDETRPAQTQMDPKARKGLSIGMVFPVPGQAAKAGTGGSSRKTTHGQGHALNDAYQGVLTDYLISHPAPQPLLDRPQIGCLADKGAAMDLGQDREKVRIVLLEIGNRPTPPVCAPKS